jgi:hypothetical protein
VWDTNDGGIIRTTPWPTPDGEDFSQWSDEKRAEVLAKANAERAERRAAEEAYNRELAVLRESARAKLTTAEYDAVVLEGRD